MYRVVLVDDEPLIRKGLTSFIDWEGLGCQIVKELGDGQEALEFLIGNETEILVCDIKMPRMSGLELVQKLHERNVNVKTIFLTAFSSFSYAQAAIRYQVVDYVVKTNYIEKLPSSIEKAIQKIRQESEIGARQKELLEKINYSQQELRKKLIYDIVSEIVTDPLNIEHMAYSSNLILEQYKLIAFCFQGADILAADSSAYDHTMHMLQEFILLAYQDRELITVLIKRNTIITLVNAEDKNIEQSDDRICDDTYQMMKLISSSIGISLCAGISLLHNGCKEVYIAYQEAQLAAENMAFYQEHDIEIYDPTRQEARWSADILELLKSINYSIKHFSKSEVSKLVHQLFECCLHEALSARNVKRLAIIICSACYFQIITYKRAETLTGQEGMFTYQDILSSLNINELNLKVQSLIASMEPALEGKGHSYTFLVRQAISYIQKHYMDDLSLSTIADQLHVSKRYLANLYKKEVGESYVDTITKYRVEKAIEMLCDPSMRVSEISSEVGFDDPAYFTNVFTKYMGMSPTVYRNTLL